MSEDSGSVASGSAHDPAGSELVSPANDAASADRVEALLGRMTLEEKVGQMIQLAVGALAAADSPRSGRLRLDPGRVREALCHRHVGSVLNVFHGALTADGWHELIREIRKVTLAEPGLGIPVLYGIDAVHGANYTVGSAIFPHNLGMAATFDPALIRSAAEITAAEVLASGLPWNFAPVLDVGRQPLWARFCETYGEDVGLASALGSAAIAGLQACGRLAATAKHYVGYSGPRSGRDRTPAMLTRREVREQFLPPFREAIAAGVRTVMVNSGEIDGEPVHASHYWLTEVLRDELGFDGVVVSDWSDVAFLHTRHRVAPTLRDAVRLAVHAGIDMSMTPDSLDFADQLACLVREGCLAEDRIDLSVRRVLTLKAELGLFDGSGTITRAPSFPAHGSHSVARRAARESLTLLKNDGLLPLRPDARILVTGPAADSLTALCGGWSYTWQGTDRSQFPADSVTVLAALRARAASVCHAPGAGFLETIDVDEAARMAAAADTAIVVLGEDAYAEWVGDIDDLTLPEAQLRLADAVIATGTPTVLVLVQGRPRLIERVADRAAAILMAYWPGLEGGEAIAEVLFGSVNPCGRLPFTYPRRPNALIPYDHKFTETLNTELERGQGGFDPQFSFGHGLGYTTFAYGDLRLGSETLDGDGQLVAQVTVTNTGARDGKETVLLFVRQHYGSLTPHVRRLRGFQKVELQPGESRTLTFTIAAADLAVLDRNGCAVIEPGTYDVIVGELAATFAIAGAAE